MVKKTQPTIIDFDTGESTINKYGEYRDIQSRLYQLNNPYVGTKRGLIVDIYDSIEKENIKHKTVLDLFSGSGVVSIFFKMIGSNVISNDLLTSSYYNTLVFCQNNTISLSKKDINYLLNNKNGKNNGFIINNYLSRFTAEECNFLDNYRANIFDLLEEHKLSNIDSEIFKGLCFTTMLHYILDKCFLGGRLNHGQVLANLDHRIAHDRNKGHSMAFKISPLPLFKNDSVNCRSYNLDALEVAQTVEKEHKDIDFAYIDPPYGGAQSDYSGMYSFCEEYVYSKKIDQIEHIEKSIDLFKKKTYQENFKSILAKINYIPNWAVSFNSSSFDDCDTIISILKCFKSDVKVINIDHRYKYRKEKGDAVEYLFLAK